MKDILTSPLRELRNKWRGFLKGIKVSIRQAHPAASPPTCRMAPISTSFTRLDLCTVWNRAGVQDDDAGLYVVLP